MIKRLGQTALFAATTALLGSACIVDHGVGVLRDDEPAYAGAPAYAPPPAQPASSDDVWSDSSDDSAGASVGGPGVEVSDQTFYDRLTPYGHWSWTPEYGRVWIPDGVDSGWRPYWDGSWVLTDWGWTFSSPVPWGWAAYHYGRWGWGVGLGWYWIPGRVWGPAWVSWRYGGGYVSWAPLGPRGYYWGVHSAAWTTVGTTHFTSPIRTAALSQRQAAPIVASARPQAYVAPSRMTGGRVTAGPPVSHIAQATGHAIAPTRVSSVIGRNSGIGRSISRSPGSSYGSRPGSSYRSRSYSNSYGSRSYGTARGADRWNSAGRSTGRYGSSGTRGSGGRWGGGYSAPRSGARGGSTSHSSGARSSGGGGHSGGGHSGGGHHK